MSGPCKPSRADTSLSARIVPRDGILALAREGERLGLHSAMIADHIVLPVESQSTYPYTLDGKHPSVGDALKTFSSNDAREHTASPL